MPPDQKPEPVAVDADGLATLLAAMTIEIVAALHPAERSPEQALTDIANRLNDAAAAMPRAVDRVLVNKLAAKLIGTENAGLG